MTIGTTLGELAPLLARCVVVRRDVAAPSPDPDRAAAARDHAAWLASPDRVAADREQARRDHEMWMRTVPQPARWHSPDPRHDAHGRRASLADDVAFSAHLARVARGEADR